MPLGKQRKLKCYGIYCYPKGTKHNRDKLTRYRGKNYCEKCIKHYFIQKRTRNDLYHYIEDQWKITFPTGRMLKQIKEMVSVRGYTYFGIHQTLEYMVKVQNKQLSRYFTLGYVPFVYEAAKDWYLANQYNGNNMNKPNTNTEELGQQINNEIQNVQTTNRKQSKDVKSIDMDSIFD